MEGIYRFGSSAVLALLSLFAPVKPMVYSVLCFIIIDFISGVAASRATAKRNGKSWYFESFQAWRTLHKIGFTITAVAMCWVIESCLLDFMTLNLTKLFAGFICSVELWSFLENASQLSDAPLFEWMRKYLHRRIDKQLNG